MNESSSMSQNESKSINSTNCQRLSIGQTSKKISTNINSIIINSQDKISDFPSETSNIQKQSFTEIQGIGFIGIKDNADPFFEYYMNDSLMLQKNKAPIIRNLLQSLGKAGTEKKFIMMNYISQ